MEHWNVKCAPQVKNGKTNDAETLRAIFGNIMWKKSRNYLKFSSEK